MENINNGALVAQAFEKVSMQRDQEIQNQIAMDKQITSKLNEEIEKKNFVEDVEREKQKLLNDLKFANNQLQIEIQNGTLSNSTSAPKSKGISLQQAYQMARRMMNYCEDVVNFGLPSPEQKLDKNYKIIEAK